MCIGRMHNHTQHPPTTRPTADRQTPKVRQCVTNKDTRGTQNKIANEKLLEATKTSTKTSTKAMSTREDKVSSNSYHLNVQ